MAGDVDGTPETEQLRDELMAARADIERLEGEAADAVAQAERVRSELRAAEELIVARESEAAGLQAQVEHAAQSTREAVARYAEVRLEAEPALPPELVRGESIADIDAALEAARAVVGRVRSMADARSEAARTPAGAPPRGVPDMSAMTPEQKIRLGLSQRGDPGA